MPADRGSGSSQSISLGPARIACLVALAHRCEALVSSGAVKGYAELARLGHVSRARVTQIMNLLNLSPEIQEYLLGLTSELGPDITERDLRPIAAEVNWDRQRTLLRVYQQNRASAVSDGGSV